MTAAGGQQQSVAINRTMASMPPLLLLKEPFRDLAPAEEYL